MQGLAIRESTIEDAEKIAHINTLTWGDSYAGIVSDAILEKVDWTERRKWQQEIYAAGQKKSFVATIDNEIVGYCNTGPMNTPDEIPAVSNSDFKGNEKEWGEIYSIYVLKSYQRLGIGTMLFERAKHALTALGYKQFQTYALRNNIPALNFYSSLGGVQIATRNWSNGEETYKEIGLAFYI